jgi:hypothetical protein
MIYMSILINHVNPVADFSYGQITSICYIIVSLYAAAEDD